jgi:anhydro-N-acetylmuramic acid kinase
MCALYIGLISGTSMDGVDAALVDFSQSPLKLIATHSEPISVSLRKALGAFSIPGENEINRLGELDCQLGHLFANAVNALLQKSSIPHSAIKAIGSHGQTIRHQPKYETPFTLQITDPNIISEKTGITTVADFRRRDIANGGQGAPLTPAFHEFLFRDKNYNRVILNIGGIANITLLSANPHSDTIGFDTGPGNTLLDNWAQHTMGYSYDNAGKWGNTGACQPKLLQKLLADPYFALPPPKSTGREYFNLDWLNQCANIADYSPVDVQRTLAEFTATTIMNAINQYMASPSQIFICGGGIYNQLLLQLLDEKKGYHTLHSTAEFGLSPDWVEAVAFAWFAKQTLNGQAINLTRITGATKCSILGGIYLAPPKLNCRSL